MLLYTVVAWNHILVAGGGPAAAPRRRWLAGRPPRAMMAGEALLLKSLNAPPSFEASPARFYVLFAFCLLSFNQCLFWITFSPIAGNAKEYYGIDDGQIALLLNWGPIIYIPVCGVTSWLTSQKNGLRRVCLGSGVATAVAMVVRCVPSWRAAPHGGGGAGAGGAAVGSGSGGSGTGAVWPQDQCQLQREGGGAAAQTIGPLDWIDVGCLHFAQIVNAAVGPPVMASPSLLSAQWFPDQERNRATAAAILSNNFGAAMGALVSATVAVSRRGAGCSDASKFRWGAVVVRCRCPASSTCTHRGRCRACE
jgi:hypothetical protein